MTIGNLTSLPEGFNVSIPIYAVVDPEATVSLKITLEYNDKLTSLKT
jgi:hypothetical protein